MTRKIPVRQIFSFKIFSLILAILWTSQTWAAVLHFYNNPRVPQPLFHVAIEYQGFLYEAAPPEGGKRHAMAEAEKLGDIQIEISDSLVNFQALEAELGKEFDFNFEWENDKTYCSKMVGKALSIKPTPMNFAGTHYVIFKPHWIHRHDPGLSPDQVYQFALEHSLKNHESFLKTY